MFYKVTCVLFCVLISSCILPPYHLTEVASVFVHNNTNQAFEFQSGLNSNWGERSTINVQDFESFRYEVFSKKEPFPDNLDSFKFYLPDCVVLMNRQHIDAYAKRPASGRLGWDIIVDASLIKNIGCE